MLLPEKFLRKLSGGYGFTKIDLADAYNQIMLGPETQWFRMMTLGMGIMYSFYSINSFVIHCRTPICY